MVTKVFGTFYQKYEINSGWRDVKKMEDNNSFKKGELE